MNKHVKDHYRKKMIEFYGSEEAWKEALSRAGKKRWEKHPHNWITKKPEEERKKIYSEMGKKGAAKIHGKKDAS